MTQIDVPTTTPVEVRRPSLDGPFIKEDTEARTFRVHRSALRSPEVFALEQERIWGRTWLYLGHESEIPNPNDFVVRTLGGRPLIFCRDADGGVRVYYNSCPHRGTTLCRETEGNNRFFRCFYHAWTFNTSGELVSLPGADGYPDGDDFRERLTLRTVAKVESLRGFVFVNFDPDAGPLADHLGNAADYIELVADHNATGMEVIPGTQRYKVWGNWKLAVENAMDGYHFTPTHITFVDYLKRTGYTTSDEGGKNQRLDNGHSVLLLTGHSGRAGMQWEPRFGEAERIRIEENRVELEERLGVERAARVADVSRILYVFPNLILFDIEALSIRRLEPTAADRTEVDAWELAPLGEPEEARALRNRVLVSFIGPGGLATPDDIEAYEAIQRGIVATAGDQRLGHDWNDISRGMVDDDKPGPGRSIDEGGIRHFWRKWNDAISERES
ncbi:aromatic ring-hydroxylating oxygenase subunit alpha [Desertimonas flava]|uniref:aromatic ring-hydroxylating oxygenase subunit alpha n=1 Tax=Desertimonas flava TaxID=2064846 RepID=UPI000E3479BF|nr:aromatic ring-hydroxylating dioxygenase subunit alpha [Desertimonas flava]